MELWLCLTSVSQITDRDPPLQTAILPQPWPVPIPRQVPDT